MSKRTVWSYLSARDSVPSVVDEPCCEPTAVTCPDVPGTSAVAGVPSITNIPAVTLLLLLVLMFLVDLLLPQYLLLLTPLL
jgi:hypothetical protein